MVQKSDIIPRDGGGGALNQKVFPAHAGERLIGRIVKAIPTNQIRNVLGGSRTQAEQLVAAGTATSVVPMAGGRIGSSVGAFNQAELAEFLARLCAPRPVVAGVPDGYCDLGTAARRRSSTAEILGWQLEGRLSRTRQIEGPPRIDRLRFCLDEIRNLARARSRTDVHWLSVVTLQLGIPIEVVKRLISAEGGAPLLALVPPQECLGLHGKAYVSSAKIERFKVDYLTLGRAAAAIGMHPAWAKALLDRCVAPVRDPPSLGARLYRRRDAEAFVGQNNAHLGPPADLHERPVIRAKTTAISAELTETAESGEKDASLQ